MASKAGHSRIHLLNAVILAWIWAFSTLRWSALPEEIPVHFTLWGEADRWAAKSWGNWLQVPLVALGMTVLFYATARLSARYPGHVNIPGRVSMRELLPERRRPILDLVRELLFRIAALLNVQWLLVQMGVYGVAIGSSDRLPWYVRAVMLAVIPLVLLLTVTTMFRLRKMAAEAAGAGVANADYGGHVP